MAGSPPEVLVIGYGNPGRLDDGLGPRAAAAVARWDLDGVTVDSDYQLQVEDAERLARYDVVVFLDADVACADPCEFRRLEPAVEASFSTHSVAPGALLSMAQDMFGARTRAYTLGIRGHEFNEFGERLSDQASANLEASLRFLERILRERSFEEEALVGRDA
jgi:hydrogenase maturation protease